MSDLQVFLYPNNIDRRSRIPFLSSYRLFSRQLLLALMFSTTCSYAEETTLVNVQHTDKTYRTELSTTIHASPLTHLSIHLARRSTKANSYPMVIYFLNLGCASLLFVLQSNKRLKLRLPDIPSPLELFANRVTSNLAG